MPAGADGDHGSRYAVADCSPGYWRERRLKVANVITRMKAGAGGVALRGAVALDPDRYEVTIVTARLRRRRGLRRKRRRMLGRATVAAGLTVLNVPGLVSPISPGKDRPALRRCCGL